MMKRPAASHTGREAYAKRQKLSSLTNIGPSSSPENIHSAGQLEQLLTFDQDCGRAKYGIQSFKTFLDGFSGTGTDQSSRTSILQEFLESQKPSDDIDKSAVYLSHIMQTWSFASQSNDESLLSACPAVCALLLRTIFSVLDLSEHGLRLVRTLLLKRQQELIARCVSSNKTKDFLISPALRLLREMSIFDGGSLSKQVFKTRERTFKNLARNLNLRFKGDGVETPKKPSVRTNAIRLVLSFIKFLPGEAKREILNRHDISTALTKDLQQDPPFLIREILGTLQSYVLLDETLSRDVKSKVVNAASLARVATLYRYDQPPHEAITIQPSIDHLAHNFLLISCTSATKGILNSPTGYYPRGIDPDEPPDIETDYAPIDLGLDSIEWVRKFVDKIPVRNTTLSEFIQNLRPWSSRKESELLLAILQSAPELVADYFYGKRSFSFQPKLTDVWMGYSAFVFSALQLPVPEYFGHRDCFARLPPPHAIVLENLLPTPLSQKIMTRCLNSQENMLSFYAIKLLCKVLIKLQKILLMYQEAAQTSPLWIQAAEQLTDKFCLRCPSIKDVIRTFRNMSGNELMQREAATGLLVLYHEVIPNAALDAKFDVSATLPQTLQAMNEPMLSPEDYAFRSSELKNLFLFAHYSSGTRWFTKLDNLSMSPFMAMLKLSSEASADAFTNNLRAVLDSVIESNYMFQTDTPVLAIDSLLLILKSIDETKLLAGTYAFLDDCISKCAANPTKYRFLLEQLWNELGIAESNRSPVSLLTLTIAEQWPFLVKSVSDVTLQDVSQSIASYFAASVKIGEDKKTVKLLTKRIVEITPETSAARKTIGNFRMLVDAIEIPAIRIFRAPDPKIIQAINKVDNEKEETLTAIMINDSKDQEDHTPLTKWSNKDVPTVIGDGHLAALFTLLCSPHLHIRKEAFTNIQKFSVILKSSSYEEKDQIWLMTCELIETARPQLNKLPFSNIIVAFAIHAITVLADPLHPLFEKVNNVLVQGPTWDPQKIPLLHRIMDEAPTLDDARYTEIAWFLDVLLAGLREENDLSIFRQRRVFDRILSLYGNVYVGGGIRKKILRLMFQSTCIRGGSALLITRCSILGWLRGELAQGGGTVLKILMDRIFRTCDVATLGVWHGRQVEDLKREFEIQS